MGKGGVFAALTTTMGFGVLMISGNRGIFSLGIRYMGKKHLCSGGRPADPARSSAFHARFASTCR